MLGNALNEAFKVVHFKTISVNIYYVQRFVAFHIDVDLVISRREKILHFRLEISQVVNDFSLINACAAKLICSRTVHLGITPPN